MGYRSNLMVLIYPDIKNPSEEQPLYDQLKVLMGTTFKQITEEYFGSCMTWMDSDHVLKFDIPDVKWYPDYSHVQMFEKMLGTFKGSGDDDEDITGYCTEFVRIGEDSDDVEEVHTGHNNHYYLSVRREIDCNV